MRSTFSGLEMGRRALQSQQRALDVTGHNIANANTEGYSRQRATMQATNPLYYPGYNKPFGAGQVGTGVAVEEIKRIRDSFTDTQIRKESAPAGEWEARSATLQKLEGIVNEPSDTGIRTLMTQFWEGIQTLTTRPEDRSVRAIVRQRGIDLATTFNQMDRSLGELQRDIDKSIGLKVDEINNIAHQMAGLNREIVQIEASGDNANDLRDKRDLLVDQLSKIIKVEVSEGTTGAYTVTVNGYPLVRELKTNEMAAVQGPPDNFASIQWASDNTPVDIKSGELKGLIYSRDNIVEGHRNELNKLAMRFMALFNGQHQLGYGLDSNTNVPVYTPGASGVSASLTASAGPSGVDFSLNPQTLVVMVDGGDPQVITLDQDYSDVSGLATALNSKLSGVITTVDVSGNLVFESGTVGVNSSVIVTGEAAGMLGFGRVFFNGTSSGDIRVDESIDNTDYIAAAAGPLAGSPPKVAPGDNGNALLLAALKHDAKTMGSTTFDDYYRGVVAKLGVDTLAADRMSENQNLLLQQLDQQRQMISGVSLDEEMTSMIKFQHAYNAAARVVTSMDEMLDTIINRLGTVGR